MKKCPQCNAFQGVDIPLCSSCNYQFAFNSSTTGISDEKMMGLIAKIEEQHPHLYYTKNQYIRLLQSTRSRSKLWLFMPIVIGTVIGLSFSFPFSYLFLLAFLTLLITLLTWTIFYPTNDRKTIDKFVSLWLAMGKGSNHLLVSPQLNQQLHDYDPHSYAIKQVIVVAKDIHVDWLVKNQLHLHYDALVISANLYPNQAYQWLEKNVPINPQIPVFLLQTPEVKAQELIDRLKPLEQKFNIDQLEYHPVDVYNQSLINNGWLKKNGKKVLGYKQPLELDLLPIEEIDLVLAQAIQRNNTIKPVVNVTSPPTNPHATSTNSFTQTLQQLRNNVENASSSTSVPPIIQNVVASPPVSTKAGNPQGAQAAQQLLNNLQRDYWKVQQQLKTLTVDYQKLKDTVKQKQQQLQSITNQKVFNQGIDQQINQVEILQKEYVSFQQELQRVQSQLQTIDPDLLPKQATDIEVLRQQIAEVHDRFEAQLKQAQQEDLTAQLEHIKIRAGWDAYQAQVKQLLDAQEKLETLEMQFLPYKEKIDEQAAELWQAFDQALAPLKDEKAKKAKTRDLIIDYGQQIKNLVKDKETCDQIEAHYQTSINELTQLTQQIEAWQNNHATDQMMDMKNKELWLNYANYEEETFWKTYRELLYNVKNPMIGIASPVQPPQQKQQWEQLYDILGL